MNLQEQTNRIKEIMGVISENDNFIKTIKNFGIPDTIKYVGSYDLFKQSKFFDSVFKMVDDLLKDFTDLIIVDNYSDGNYDDKNSSRAVAYGEGHNDFKIKPGYVYFDWYKSPMNKPTATLSVDEKLSDVLSSLDLPDNLMKDILVKWVNKYYDNIPPIDNVKYGKVLGYGNDETDDHSSLIPPPHIPFDDNIPSRKITEDEIIELLKDAAEKFPKENCDDLMDWMNIVFTYVEDYIDDNNIDTEIKNKSIFSLNSDNLRKKYDYVLRDIWGPDNDYPFLDDVRDFDMGNSLNHLRNN